MCNNTGARCAPAAHLSSDEYWCYDSGMITPLSLSSAGHLPFKYVGGAASMDLVNTVDWTMRGPVEDRLTDYERLTRWAEGAGVISSRQGMQLRAAAVAHPRLAERDYRDALELRWQLRRLFTAVPRGERLEGTVALRELNDSLRQALTQRELVAPKRGVTGPVPLQWSWRDATERLESILWPVMLDAAELLASDDATLIRECAGHECGWMYVDRSRNGLRRWCQMETCGNREKARRRAAAAPR
jgi:predicted RNA-binding Zn ribbon-like protein